MQKLVANAIIEDKELYTIEDLIKVCIELDRFVVSIKNANMDIQALEEKIKILDSKIKNATLFITEIDNHKKSIF